MTSCTSPSASSYESSLWCEAEWGAGVRYRIARVSVARRIDLARRLREIGRRMEFLEAGGDAREKLEAAALAGEMNRAYLEWGLEEVVGLTIDGQPASPALLIERGPVELADEILRRIQRECGLSGDERKN
jgi:hypothetical protein